MFRHATSISAKSRARRIPVSTGQSGIPEATQLQQWYDFPADWFATRTHQ
jgi:hypothetical protein